MSESTYGLKLNQMMIDNVINNILKNKNNQQESQRIMWLISNKLGFNKFKSIDDIERNKLKFERILRNESAFNGNLGLSLMQFFGLKPLKTIIYEDFDGIGRTVKERIHGSAGFETERILSFIPIFNNADDAYTVDDQIKEWDRIAENSYDAIEGRYYERKPLCG